MNTHKTPHLKANLSSTIAAVWFSIFGLSCYGASVPWVGVLSTGSPITVPANKILIIEHMCFNNTTANGIAQPVAMTLSGTNTSGIGSGNYSATIQYTVSSIGGYTAPTNGIAGTLTQSVLRLNEGATLRLISGSPYVISVVGVAIDASDFHASANPVVSNDGGQLAVTIDSRTTNKTVTSGEASSDLQSWTGTGSKVTTTADSPRKFLRGKLKSIL